MPWQKVTFTEEEVEDGAPGRFEKAFRQRFQDNTRPKTRRCFPARSPRKASRISCRLRPPNSRATCWRPTPMPPPIHPDRDDVRLAVGRRGVTQDLL